MTEADWLVCRDPWTLVTFLVLRGKPDLRKWRLYYCGQSRLAWDKLDEDTRLAVEISESYADDLATEDELEAQRYADPAPFGRGDVLSVVVVPIPAGGSTHFDLDRTRLTSLSQEERQGQADLVRCIFGNPFRPSSIEPLLLTETVTKLATTIYEQRSFEWMPILADALEECGVAAEALNHCRQPGVHARGCWVVDLILGKS